MDDLAALSKKKPKPKGSFSQPAAPNPLDGVVYSDPPNLAADTAAELNAVQEAFKARATREAARFADATDTEFWIALCFRSRADKERFLKLYNLAQLGDKYLDGDKVAQLLGTPAKH